MPELAPAADDIVITKTTDSALTGTNLRLILSNMGIENVVVAGIFTDQCVSSTVRSLADESFNVVVVEDCCAAATMELHRHELEVINMIYCHVATLDEVMGFFALSASRARRHSRDTQANPHRFTRLLRLSAPGPGVRPCPRLPGHRTGSARLPSRLWLA